MLPSSVQGGPRSLADLVQPIGCKALEVTSDIDKLIQYQKVSASSWPQAGGQFEMSGKRNIVQTTKELFSLVVLNEKDVVKPNELFPAASPDGAIHSDDQGGEVGCEDSICEQDAE